MRKYPTPQAEFPVEFSILMRNRLIERPDPHLLQQLAQEATDALRTRKELQAGFKFTEHGNACADADTGLTNSLESSSSTRLEFEQGTEMIRIQ